MDSKNPSAQSQGSFLCTLGEQAADILLPWGLSWVHKCATVMDDGGSGVCWAIRPTPVPALAAQSGLLAAEGSRGSSGWVSAVIPAWSLATHFVHQLCKSSAALVIWVLITYQPEPTPVLPTHAGTQPLCSSHDHSTDLCAAGALHFPRALVSLCSVWGTVGCAPTKEVGGTGDKSIMTQAQFGIGQTEAFLTMISERTLGQLPPLCSTFLQVGAEIQLIYWFRQ